MSCLLCSFTGADRHSADDRPRVFHLRHAVARRQRHRLGRPRPSRPLLLLRHADGHRQLPRRRQLGQQHHHLSK